MQTRVYRAGAWGWILGIGLILFGIYATWAPIDHLNSGIPWQISNGRYSHGWHYASRSEIVGRAFEHTAIWLTCILVLYMVFKRKVTLDRDGAIVSTAFKGTNFMEPYCDLECFTKHVGRKSVISHTLSSRNRRVVSLSSVYGGLDDMIREVLLRAPQLGYVHGTDDSANS